MVIAIIYIFINFYSDSCCGITLAPIFIISLEIQFTVLEK